MFEPLLLTALGTGLPVVVRIAALVGTMPLLGSRLVPIRVKIAMVIALSAMVLPATLGGHTAAGQPVLLDAEWMVMLVTEALLGALLGLSLSVVLASVQLAGELIEGLCGFSLASFAGPSAPETGRGPFTQLFWWTTAAVFIAAGGLGQLVDGLLASFAVLPVGQAVVDRSFQDFLVQSLTQAFSFGLSAAMPAIAALLAASLVLGMAQRNFPQLGGMQVGLNAQAICGMLVTSCLLLTAPWIVNGGLQMTLDQLQSFLAGAAGG